MTLLEQNKKVISDVLVNAQEIKEMRESFKRMAGFDPLVGDDRLKKFPVHENGFSWKKLQAKLSEADSATNFIQFLRAGVQSLTNAMYEVTETTFEKWTTTVASSKDTELYAPNHGVAFPRQVGRQEKYPEVGAAALDIQLKNHKYGSIYSLERELLEDDQTGSFQRQAGILGEYMKVLTEVLCYGKLASATAMQYIDYAIPTSETKPSYESSYPWSTALRGGGANRPSSFGILNQGTLQNAFIAMMNQKNLQGIKMQVNPDMLICGPKYRFDASHLLNSAYYPSSVNTTAGGAVGGIVGVNVLKGICDLVISRFMFKNDGTVAGDSMAWYLADSKKPWFVLQLREAVTVLQENEASGRSFDEDVIRFKARSRMNADHIDPRFCWQGNDGSITS
jgi:hypothetical protein